MRKIFKYILFIDDNLKEVYLINTFKEDFYNEILSVEINGFLRCESDFKDFGNNC